MMRQMASNQLRKRAPNADTANHPRDESSQQCGDHPSRGYLWLHTVCTHGACTRAAFSHVQRVAEGEGFKEMLNVRCQIA